jgi:YrbI family 3-deoxy-D-manno-octulosonate 8-phosphate phosphatase
MRDAPRLSDLDLLVLDFDGVLTDNRVWVFEDGREAVACNRGDGMGCDLLREAGLPMVIISTEKNPVVSERARKIKLPVFQAVGDKRTLLATLMAEKKVDPSRVGYVGNDINDMAAMEAVGWPIAPADAHARILRLARFVTRACGGHGVVRELADVLLGEPL